MLVTNSIHFSDSDHLTQFTTAIAAVADGSLVPASEYADIQIVEGTSPAGGLGGQPGHLTVKSARILAMESTRWRLEFYDRSVPQATPASFAGWGLLGAVEFPTVGGPQPSNAYYATSYKEATLFVSLAELLDIPIHDKTAQGQIHVRLSNIGTVAKSAGSAGALQLRVGTIINS